VTDPASSTPAFTTFDAARAIVDDGVRSHAMPAAVAEVGTRTGRLWTHAAGTLTYDPAAARTTPETIFDLASLTKVIATTSLVMHHLHAGTLELDTPIRALLPSWRGADRAAVTVRHLLDHSSGLPAHVRLWEQARGRDAFEDAIVRIPLDAPPGARSVYSDLGFMLLGFLLADVGGRPLDEQWADWRRVALPLDVFLAYGAVGDLASGRPGFPGPVAPTELDPWRGRVLTGEVHDENAAALGGVAAHAGLFGTASAVGAFARLVLQTFRSPTPLGPPDVVRVFARSTRPHESRALGWDTMRLTSSCGALMSPAAIGHTGFTGTSLWIDPEQDLYVVLLTNRVHPTRENQALPQLRPRFHDAVMRALRGPKG
jgi:CubicO group peptidase (beta-lactamase class C family)